MKTADTLPAPATDETPPLVFHWASRRSASWRLASLIALSLLVHAFGFYVFQVAYTPTGSQAAPSVQVTMLPAMRVDASPEVRAQTRTLAQVLTVDDPALTVVPAFQEGDRSGGFVQYVPSYKAASPPFKPLDPPTTGNAAPPRPRPPGPVPVLPASSTGHSRAPAPPTRVTLSDDISSFAPKVLPPTIFVLPAGAKTLDSSVFLVGLRSEGGTVLLFRESSSGDVTADDYARDYLARLNFQPLPPSENGATVWGWAEFHWGWDVYR